jgi:hypothetical protein
LGRRQGCVYFQIAQWETDGKADCVIKTCSWHLRSACEGEAKFLFIFKALLK